MREGGPLVLPSARLRIDVIVGIFVLLGSLVLTAQVNRYAGLALSVVAPRFSWIATTAAPSCLVILLLFLLLADRQALHWHRLTPDDRWRALMLAATWLSLWLAGSVVTAIVAGHWIVYATGGPAIAAFLGFGPIGEELLFRGLVFERVRRMFPTTRWPAIIVSTGAFSLHHLALDAAPHGLLLAQVAFTIPMGLVLGALRDRTRGIWPGLTVHVLTNIPATL